METQGVHWYKKIQIFQITKIWLINRTDLLPSPKWNKNINSVVSWTNLTAPCCLSSDIHPPPGGLGSAPHFPALRGSPGLCWGRSRGPTLAGWSPRWPACLGRSGPPGSAPPCPRLVGSTGVGRATRPTADQRGLRFPPRPALCLSRRAHHPPARRS